MRPRAISLFVALGVFLGGLAALWALGPAGRRHSAGGAVERTFTFPLNSSSRTASVRSHWRLGHLTAQDDAVELTLVGNCATAHLYAYLTTGWDRGPLNAAAMILGMPLHPVLGPAPRVVRRNSHSAIVVSRESQRGVLVVRDAPRSFDALVMSWASQPSCARARQQADARELGRLFQTFRVGGFSGTF